MGCSHSAITRFVERVFETVITQENAGEHESVLAHLRVTASLLALNLSLTKHPREQARSYTVASISKKTFPRSHDKMNL
jgi:hypothetical protein